MEKTRRQNEEDRRQSEQNRRTEEHRQHQQKSQLEEWEKLQASICFIRQELRGDTINETEKADLLDDLSGLVSRKKELGFALGFNK
jgi:hypothetical protein